MKKPRGHIKPKNLNITAKKIQKNKPISFAQLSEFEAQKLIHELEVRKIEIDMQTEEISMANKQTVIANKKYVDLFDFAPSGYFILSKNGKISEVNLYGSQLLCKERAYLKDQQITNFISVDTRPIFYLFLEKIFNNKTNETCGVTLSINNHEPMYVYLTGLVNEGDEQCLVNMINITEFKLSQNELIKAKEHAEESDRLKSAFLQNIGHEVRTPMNAIIGFSELLVKHYDKKVKLEKYGEIIKQNCIDLLQIINDILDIAKIESGQLPVFIEKCELSKLFSELTYFFTDHQKLMGKEHIQFGMQTSFNASENIIATDKDILKQIFIKLIDNAFKFTEAGKIEVGCQFDVDHNLLFYVLDTGIGIPIDKQSLIFEHFAQVDNGFNRLYGGTGLGLSIVKGLVTLLGGNIWIKTKPNEGTTFFFTILNKAITLSTSATVLFDEPQAYLFHGKTILVVEDDLYNVQYLKEILADTGSKILYASYGRDAIQISVSQPIDLVLMDVRLPDMDGYEATRQIRKRKPYLKIIAQTAFASPNEKQKATDAGCNDYISRPSKQGLLLSMIRKHLLK